MNLRPHRNIVGNYLQLIEPGRCIHICYISPDEAMASHIKRVVLGLCDVYFRGLDEQFRVELTEKEFLGYFDFLTLNAFQAYFI